VEFYTFTRQYPSFLFPGRTDRDPSKLPLRADAIPLIDPINPLTWLRAARRIRDSQADLSIMQWWVPYWAPAFATIAFLARRLSRTRILFICHNVAPHERRVVDRVLAKLTLSQGHSFIVHSQGDEARLRNLLPQAHIVRTVHPIYDFFRQDGLPDQKSAARKALNLPDRKVLLFFGFVRPYKGLEYLLQAMPKVLTEIDAHLLVVGEFWAPQSRYTSYIDDLGLSEHVTIVNRYVPNEEVHTFFSAADVVVLPYIEATQSGVAQIAFGFERPVITTDVGGLSEVVRHGETGLLVPPGQSEPLAEAITSFFRADLGERFAANIHKERQRFSWDRLVDLIEALARVDPATDEAPCPAC
jgi:glycosyltransferase involved in cell wall biosynthesis